MTDSTKTDSVVSMTASQRDDEQAKESPAHIFGEMRQDPEQIKELFRNGRYPYKTRFMSQPDRSTMAMTLRPGESVTRRTAYFGRSAMEPLLNMDSLVNGDICYRPNFADGTYRHGVSKQRGVVVRNGRLRPVSKESFVDFDMACAHPMLNGTVELSFRRAGDEITQMLMQIFD